MVAKTQLSGGLPGRRYGSFAGRVAPGRAALVGPITQLSPTGGITQRYYWAPAPFGPVSGCRFRLVYEVTTIRVPRYTVVSEDCGVPNSCCAPEIPTFLCDDEQLAQLNSEDLCDLRWYTTDATGFDDFPELEVSYATVMLPHGSTIVSTDCYTFECGDTISLDCECD